MREHLKSYIDLLFAGANNCDDIKQEILQNTLDRYDDLIAQGKTPEAAYQLAISGIGDISELIGRNQPAAQPQVTAKTQPFEPAKKQNRTPASVSCICWIIGTITFLALSFATSAWYITWMVFCIVPCITGVISGICNLRSRTASSIVKIVLLSLLALILITIMVLGIIGVSINIGFFGFDGLPDGTEARSATITDAHTIDRLDIRWVDGSVTIVTADTNSITFSEKANSHSTPMLAWKQDGSTLIICYAKNSSWQFGVRINQAKDLTVTVPEDWFADEIDITSVSSEITVSNIAAEEFNANTVSGECDFMDCTIGTMEVESVSGDIEYTGALSNFSVEAVSADCKLKISSSPKSIKLNAVSGDMEIYLPSDCGFTASIESVSGDFSTSFATTKENGRYQFGDGTCRIQAESVSGDIIVSPK